MAKKNDESVPVWTPVMSVPTAIVAKVAGIIVHADECLGENGHHFDLHALRQLLKDKEVQDWIKSLGALAPVKRKK